MSAIQMQTMQQQMSMLMQQQAQMLAATPPTKFVTDLASTLNQTMVTDQMAELRKLLSEQEGQFVKDDLHVRITYEED